MNGILNLFWRIERTHLLSVSSSHCSTNGLTFLPLECLDLVELAVERVGFQNFVKDEACLEEGNCFGLPLLLVVYLTGCVWLCLTFRPVRLHLLWPGRFHRLLSSLKDQGPVVQSVISLTSSLRVISLTVLVLQKLLTFFQQKISAYLRIT